MTKLKKAEKKKTVTGEKILKTVTSELITALSASLKKQLGDKEFNKRVKKAAKKLVAGVKSKATESKGAVKSKKAVTVKKKTTSNTKKK